MADIESLELQITSDAKGAKAGLDALITTLDTLKTKTAGGCGLGAIAKPLGSIAAESGKLTGTEGAKLESLAKGLQALSNLGNFKLSSSIANQIGAMGAAVKTLDGVSFSNLGDLARSLTPLKNIGKSNLGSIANQIKKLPDAEKALNKIDMATFTGKIKQLADSLKPLADQLSKVSNGFSTFPSKIQEFLSASTQVPGANQKSERSFAKLMTKLTATWYAFTRGSRVIAQWINQSNTYVENLNLFTVALGKYARESQKYAEAIGEVMGIDPATWMRSQGVFMTLATGFGVASDRAHTMSQQLTQLGYDLSSFFNISEEEAMKKLQSGLSGELEPLRNLGYDLSQAKLEAIALSLGIDKAFESMTQAEKAQLRYYAIMTQVTTAQGDMARTLDAPANQLRILRAQVTQAARALGNIFIPLLNAVLPYAIAAAQAVRALANAIASLFNFSLPEIDYSSLDDVSAGAGEISDGFENAAGSAAKLKKTLLGIDELNVMPDASGGSGGDTAAGGGGGFDFELPTYNFVDEAVFGRVNEIANKLKEWLGLTEEIDSWSDFFNTRLGGILMLVGTIGLGIAAWKFGKPLMAGIDTLMLFLKAASGSTGAGSAFTLFFGEKAMAGLTKFMGVIGSTPIGKLLLGSGVSSFGATAAAIAGVVAAVAALVSGLAIVTLESENFRRGITTVFQGIGWVASGIGDIIGGVVGFVGQMFNTLVSIMPEGVLNFFDKMELGIGDLLVAAGGLALFGPWGLAIEGVVLGIKAIGIAADESLKPVDLFGNGVSEVTKSKVAPFIEAMDDLGLATKTLDWGNAIVTEADVADIGARLATVTDTILNELDSDRNQALATLDPLRAALGDARFQELTERVEQSYSTQVAQVTAWQDEINTIVATAQAERRSLTEEEAARIEEIQSQMMETGIKYLSESETESNLILQRLRDSSAQLTAEQASEVIKNAIKARDETIAAANEQYNGICMEAQRMLDTGTITKDEYDEIIAAAQRARDDTVAAAENQYADILKTAKDKMGEYAKFIDEKTGEIKTNFQVWWNDIKTGWNDFWTNLGKDIKGAWNDLVKWWEGLDLPELNFKMPHFTWGTQEATGTLKKVMEFLNIPANIPKLNVSWYANGGFPGNEGQLFVARERGPEMVGQIGSRNAVANNDQIVESVSRGVYQAVLSAMGSTRGDQVVEAKVNDKVLFEVMVSRARQETMRTGYNPLLGGV